MLTALAHPRYVIGTLQGYDGGAAGKAASAPRAVSAPPGGAPQADVPLLQKVIIPVVLLALAYGVNYYFTQ